MSNSKPTYRRRQYFIKKDFQFHFILKFCLLVLVGSGISTALLLFLSRGTLTTTYQNSRLMITDTGAAILPAAIYTNLITLGLITAATIFAVLLISHKIAGPLFRFEKELKEIGGGDLTKTIRLRKMDQITEMAEGLNRMVGALREKVVSIRDQVDRTIQRAEDEGLSDDLRNDLKKIRKGIEEEFQL